MTEVGNEKRKNYIREKKCQKEVEENNQMASINWITANENKMVTHQNVYKQATTTPKYKNQLQNWFSFNTITITYERAAYPIHAHDL